MFRLGCHLNCRKLCRVASVALLVVGSLGLLEAQGNGQFANSSTPGSVPERGYSEVESNPTKFRLREGTTITNQAGHFRHEGEGAVFVLDKERELMALPNLSLERITRTLKGFDEPEGVRWTVSGVVTEFNGRNYLLISRAVYKSSVPPPAPVQLAN
jgi:hypothetical protein